MFKSDFFKQCQLISYLTGGDVAATDQSRQLGRLGRPKNGLRSHQGDFSETSPEVTTNSPGSRGDVSETSSQLRRRLRQLRPYLIGLETRWRRLRETSRVSGESREIQTCSNFLGDFFQSPAGLGDVSATSPRPAGDVTVTSPQFPWSPAGYGDVTETSPIPAGDWKKSPKNRTCFNFPRLPGDPASLQETSRRRRGDVSATSGDSNRQLVAT